MSILPLVVTLVIVGLLVIWLLYAFGVLNLR
jgi:hypothetical protein